jgi:hypothetical protein
LPSNPARLSFVVRHPHAMKAFATFLLLAFCFTAVAIGPEYSSLRDWVEKHNAKDKTPTDERVFVNFLWKDSAIVHYRKGMTIEDVITGTQFRDRSLRVSVFRATHKPAGEPVYDEVSKKKPDRGFAVQALDVLWLEEPNTPRN